MTNLRILFLICISALFSCKRVEVANTNDYLPIIFVHGYTGSGDSYEWMAQRFTSNGYPKEKLFTFDWNTLPTNAANNTSYLEAFVKQVLAQTGNTQVNLVGHSLGGQLVYNYCLKPENAANIAHLAMICPYLSTHDSLPSDSIPTLNIWSNTDYVVTNGDSIPGAINFILNNRDHNEAAACNETFVKLYNLFAGTDPSTLTVSDEFTPVLWGRAESMIENVPAANASVQVYKVDPVTGFRLSSTPDATFMTTTSGYWGPMEADPTAYYEFRVSTTQPNDRPIHYYREPFKHSDHLVYLRTYPPPASILSLALSGIPKNNNQADAIYLGPMKALWLGRDELSINTISLNSMSFMDPHKNNVAIFLYDNNGNHQTDTTSIPLFSALGGLAGSDFYFPASTPQTITVTCNGHALHMRNWPSADEGISVALFQPE